MSDGPLDKHTCEKVGFDLTCDVEGLSLRPTWNDEASKF